MDSQHQGIQNEKCRDASSLSRFVGFVPSRRGSVFEMPAKDLGPLHRTMEAVGFWQSLTYLDHHIAVPRRSTNINTMSFSMHHFSGFFGVWLAIFSYMWRLAMTPYVAFKKFVTMVGRSASAVPGSFGQLTRTASLKKLKACLRVILTFSIKIYDMCLLFDILRVTSVCYKTDRCWVCHVAVSSWLFARHVGAAEHFHHAYLK